MTMTLNKNKMCAGSCFSIIYSTGTGKKKKKKNEEVFLTSDQNSDSLRIFFFMCPTKQIHEDSFSFSLFFRYCVLLVVRRPCLLMQVLELSATLTLYQSFMSV